MLIQSSFAVAVLLLSQTVTALPANPKKGSTSVSVPSSKKAASSAGTKSTSLKSSSSSSKGAFCAVKPRKGKATATGKGTSKGKKRDLVDLFARNDPIPLYHGTCPQQEASLSAGIDLSKVESTGDFSFKPGFYLTPSAQNAYAFTKSFRNCEPIIFQYTLNPDGLSILNLDDESTHPKGTKKKYFQGAKDIKAHTSGTLSDELQKIKTDIDGSDVIIATKPLEPGQKVMVNQKKTAGLWQGDFQQYIVLTTKAIGQLAPCGVLKEAELATAGIKTA